MAQADFPLESALNNPNISLTSSPFSPGKLIIKRASFPAGEVPEHLEPFLLSPGDVPSRTGTVVRDGKQIPATAAAVADSRG